MEIAIKLIGTQMPGLTFGHYHPVQVGMQQLKEVEQIVPGNSSHCEFLATVRVNEDKQGNPNFLGPYVFGPTGDKFLYLVWFASLGPHREMFRRAKIKLNHLSWKDLRQAETSGQPLVARIVMTDQKGGPVCASLREEQISWELSKGS